MPQRATAHVVPSCTHSVITACPKASRGEAKYRNQHTHPHTSSSIHPLNFQGTQPRLCPMANAASATDSNLLYSRLLLKANPCPKACTLIWLSTHSLLKLPPCWLTGRMQTECIHPPFRMPTGVNRTTELIGPDSCRTLLAPCQIASHCTDKALIPKVHSCMLQH